MAWGRDKKANTTASSTGKLTKELAVLITAAEKCLKEEGTEETEMLKWNTALCGDIPVDFGLK